VAFVWKLKITSVDFRQCRTSTKIVPSHNREVSHAARLGRSRQLKEIYSDRSWEITDIDRGRHKTVGGSEVQDTCSYLPTAPRGKLHLEKSYTQSSCETLQTGDFRLPAVHCVASVLVHACTRSLDMALAVQALSKGIPSIRKPWISACGRVCDGRAACDTAF
jgi:hypothetical protein